MESRALRFAYELFPQAHAPRPIAGTSTPLAPSGTRGTAVAATRVVARLDPDPCRALRRIPRIDARAEDTWLVLAIREPDVAYVHP